MNIGVDGTPGPEAFADIHNGCRRCQAYFRDTTPSACGCGIEGVRRSCSWPDRSSQTLEAATARLDLNHHEAEFGERSFVLEILFRLSRPKLASWNPAMEAPRLHQSSLRSAAAAFEREMVFPTAS
jgi:hypothetical protein